jgi:hypothetical protein
VIDAVSAGMSVITLTTGFRKADANPTIEIVLAPAIQKIFHHFEISKLSAIWLYRSNGLVESTVLTF